MPAVEQDADTPLARPEHADGKPPLASLDAETPTVGSPSLWRRVRRDVVLLGAGNVAIVLAQLAFRSILIVTLVPADYGRLSLILSIYNTVWIIGASGLPTSVARHIALIAPKDDSAIIRSAVRASAWPTIAATVIIAIVSGALLHSPLASLFAAIGLSTMVYSLLTMGILRGRGNIGFAALILPIAAIGEVAPLVIIWRSGLGVSPLSAFGVFCAGNAIGLIAGLIFTMRTNHIRRSGAGLATEGATRPVPSPRELLSFSMWLGAATAGVAILPLIIRSAAALESYTIVAVIDVAIVFLSIPQRIGAVILLAVVPHATRAVDRGTANLTISRRENIIMIIPFVLLAVVVAYTPVVQWIFDALGRPGYAKSADYFALVLLAGPARILYGLVEGVLIAHGEARFLAFTVLSVTVMASGMIFAAVALGSTVVAFIVFVTAFWLIYLIGLARISRLAAVRDPLPTQG